MQFLTKDQFGALMEQANLVFKSGLLPKSYTTVEQVMFVFLKGYEVGMLPIESLDSIDLIAGRPTISPQGKLALARRTGELEDIAVVDDGNTCAVTVKRRGQTPHTTKFSMDDARRITTTQYDPVTRQKVTITLAEKEAWRNYAPNMRLWRALGHNLDFTFCDVTGRMYTHEEMGANVDANGDRVEILELPPVVAGMATSALSIIPVETGGDDGWFEKNSAHEGTVSPVPATDNIPVPVQGRGIVIPSKVAPPPTNAVVLPKASSGPVKAPFTIVGQAKSVMDALVGLAKLNSYALDKNGEVNLYHLCAGIRMGGFNPVDNKLREVDRDEAVDALAKRIYDKIGKMRFFDAGLSAEMLAQTHTGELQDEKETGPAGFVSIGELINPAVLGEALEVKSENLPGD